MLLQKINIFAGSPLMLIENPKILDSFAKHHGAYKNISVIQIKVNVKVY